MWVPPRCVTNAELALKVDTSDEWIRTRSGIACRRIADTHETPAYMAVRAASQAIANAGLTSQDIDLLILATMTPDKLFPATAIRVQHELGLRPIPAFDMEVACSGFVYAAEVAWRMLTAGPYRHALVIGAEKVSSFIDWEDRTTCVLFGDGAGAVVLSQDSGLGAGRGILGSLLGSDGCQAQLFDLPAGGAAKPASFVSVQNKEHYLRMNGKEIFKHAVRVMEQCAREVLAAHGLGPESLDWVIPHQANIRILEALAERLTIPMSKVVCNLDQYGNTSAATIPSALHETVKSGKIKPGDTVLFVAFGAGLSWGAMLYRA
jgi:3-oxoacyl-[acyl-carrier-protein] synthase-3